RVVAGPEQPVRALRPTRPARQPHPRRLDAPDLVGQRLPGQAQHLPGLGAEGRAPTDHLLRGPPLDPLVRSAARALRGQAGERPGPLADATQLALVQAGDETGTLAVFLVEGQPVQWYAAGPGAVDLLQGDPPLGAVSDGVGDARRAAARAVG